MKNFLNVLHKITLMDWGNAIVTIRDTDQSSSSPLESDLHLEGDFKKTSKKIHWLPSLPSALVDVVLFQYDYIITKPKLEEDDSLVDFVNRDSVLKEEAWADANVASLKRGDIIQFERKGYYIVDKALGEASSTKNGGGEDWIELILIPDGRAQSVALKATAVRRT